MILNVVVGHLSIALPAETFGMEFETMLWDRNLSVFGFYVLSSIQPVVWLRHRNDSEPPISRAVRLWFQQLWAIGPSYWAVVIISLRIRGGTPHQYFVFLTGIQAWWYPVFGSDGPFLRVMEQLSHTWWLTAYFAWIIVVPFVFGVLSSFTHSQLVIVLGLTITTALISFWISAWYAGIFSLPGDANANYRLNCAEYWPPFCAIYLILGLVMAELLMRKKSILSSKLNGARVADLSFVALVLASFFPWQTEFEARRRFMYDVGIFRPIQLFSLVTVMLSLRDDASWIHWACMSPFARFLRDLNWELYIFHESIFGIFEFLLFEEINNHSTAKVCMLSASAVSAVVLCSWILREPLALFRAAGDCLLKYTTRCTSEVTSNNLV